MFDPRRTKLAFVALVGSAALLTAGCGFDDSSAQSQDRECEGARVGQTTRASIQDALGAPTMTDHEVLGGQRVVSDLWVDGTVGFSYDEQTLLLVEKDCG